MVGEIANTCTSMTWSMTLRPFAASRLAAVRRKKSLCWVAWSAIRERLGPWSGRAPDGKWMFVRDRSTQEVYQLSLELP